MDNGAHFHKCDFQVHTPRDINWEGAGALTDDDRREYAVEFVEACRAKGVQAVAITDHHDVAFFRYIREATLNETDDLGQPLRDADRLIVFPGMELTLGIPCQALLIFDADLPLEFLPLALTALGITPSDPSFEKHAPVQKLDIMNFDDLYAALNKLEPLRDRFIVFPHVADSGYKTLLRKGFEKHYASMSCVGGYVDGALPAEPRAAGMRAITSGQDKNWGNKAIGLFQTSDSRSRNLTRLGVNATWVKWAAPTSEALRQACLARHSRISVAEPPLPAIRLTRLEVSNSRFLGPIVADFNPQYNAIIGSRGTGKSTILEYVRWALCDQPPSTTDGGSGELADFQRRRQSLIEGTLLPLDATVDVSFVLNGVSHIVRRKASGELALKIGNSSFQACTEQNVRELLPVRAYSQKQLSAVGARLGELRRFVQAPIQGDLDTLDERISSLAADLRATFDRVARLRILNAEIAAHDIERQSLNEQIAKLRASLQGLSPEDLAIIARQSAYEAEHRVVQVLERAISIANEALRSAAVELGRLPSTVDERNLSENAELLKHAHELFAQWLASVRKTVHVFQSASAGPASGNPLAEFFAAITKWNERRAGHRAEYEQAKARSLVHEQTLQQIAALELRLAEIDRSGDVKSEQLVRLGDPAEEFAALRFQWNQAHTKRADIIAEQCDRLTSASSRLRASLKRAADTAPLADRLRQLTKGTRIRGDRIDALVQQISDSEDPIQTWNVILDELHELAWVRVEDEAVTRLPLVPHLDSAGFTQKDKLAIARQLEPSAWLGLALYDLKDLPIFEYQVRDQDFLPFENASPGQQATALLSILLLQDGPPLLIDQPEDDLNMKIINEIVQTLWDAKTHRQVIFTSHNANLVVNGDAELVICCDYRTTTAESGGRIKLTGAIDIPEINREITDVMEGGVEAFKLRQQKYGF